MYAERLPPHDLASEESVLGSILIDPEAIFKVADHLKGEDFFREANRWVYEACFALYERRHAINQVTVAHELAYREQLEAVGGASYLSYLTSMLPTSLHVEHYSRIVQQSAVLRSLIDASGRIAVLAYEGGPEADVILDRAEDIIFRLRRGRSAGDFTLLRSVIDHYLEETVAKPEGGDSILTRVPTLFEKLDAILGGLHRSDLIILAARPSMGKTSLALNIAYNAAVKEGARVAVFSLEMSKEELAERLLSSESGVDSQRLRMARLTEAEVERVIEASGVLSEALIYIDDSPMMGVVELRSRARRLHYERGIDLIVLDYIQLMQGGGHPDNRVQQITEITRSLKALARELNVPVLALSQLSRAVETRTPHTPMLSDLRESGSIEQDADVVMFIYRDDMYFTEEEWERRFPTKKYPKGIADIIIAKHRNGPIGKINLFFQERTAKFFSLTGEREMED